MGEEKRKVTAEYELRVGGKVYRGKMEAEAKRI
jgi:hypothetical protein